VCFTPVIYFFHAVIFEAEERRPAGPLPGCRNMVKFYNADQRGSYLYPYILSGENLQILPDS